MAKMSKIGGEFVSQAIIVCQESAANTITFSKLESGLTPLERVGWVLQRVDFKLSAADFGYFNGTGDALRVALCVSGSLTSIADTDPAIITSLIITRSDFGTAANAVFSDTTFTMDFSTLQGGGLLVLPNPIYFAIAGQGLTTAASAVAKLYFYPIEMTTEDYFNLVQSRQILINS